jgi:hypothetical protein
MQIQLFLFFCNCFKINQKNINFKKQFIMLKKQHYYISLITLFVICLLVGCKKEAELTEHTENLLKAAMIPELENLYKQLDIPDFGNVRLLNGDIFRFESAEHYEQVYDALNELYEAWMELFIQTYGTPNLPENADDDALDTAIERLNFDENLPLLKFVEHYKVKHPLIEDAAAQEEMWLKGGANGSPPSDPVTQCPIEQTLFSNYHEICIKDTICQLRPDGYQIIIPTSEFKSLLYIRNASIEEMLSLAKEMPPGGSDPIYIRLLNITIYPPKGGTCYESGWEYGDFQPNNTSSGQYRYYWSYHFRYNRFLGTRTTASMKNYKWKNNEWKKDYGAVCALGFVTMLYEEKSEGCVQKTPYGPSKGTPHKAFFKSRTTNASAGAPTADFKNLRDDIDASFIECRHKGVNRDVYANGNPK